MTDELYFITVLAEAFHSPEPKTSLPDAFHKIERLGHKQRYRKGFENFGYFMSQVLSRYETGEKEYCRRLILDLAAASGDDTAINKILSDPAYKDELEMINALVLPPKRNLYPVIDIFCGPRKINRLVFGQDMHKQSVTGIVPGEYILKLDTGLVLWQGRLTAKDVIWKDAFAGQNLRLAADSGEVGQKPTRRIILLDGKVVIDISAGMESGALEIAWGGAYGS